MPPKKDGNASSAVKEGQTKARKKIKSKKKRDEQCPSRIRKTDRVVLNSQARNIIVKVYDFMKKEAINEYAEKLKNARWRTATAVGVSQKTVSRILRDRKKKENGTAVTGPGALLSGKVDAAKDNSAAFNDLVHGNISGAAENIAGVAGTCLGGDEAALGIASTGVASTAGHMTGDLVAEKAAEIGDVGAGISAMARASSGNLTSAVNSFGNAGGHLVAGSDAALGSLFQQGTLEATFGR